MSNQARSTRVFPFVGALIMSALACSEADDTCSGFQEDHELGDLEAEQCYADSRGYGMITVVEDQPSTEAFVSDGNRFIFIETSAFAGEAQAVRDHVLTHELGHHYLNHVNEPPTNLIRDEYLADAFCARVMWSTFGDRSRVNLVTEFLRDRDRAADGTHPSDAARADYIDAVVDAAETDPSFVPPPPVGSMLLSGVEFENSSAHSVDLVAANARRLARLGPGERVRLAAPPASSLRLVAARAR